MSYPQKRSLSTDDINSSDDQIVKGARVVSDENLNKLENASSDDKIRLVANHLLLIRKEADKHRNSRKTLLQNRIKEIREEIQNGKKNGRDPLQIFPEEIWAIIMDYVTETNDLESYSKTCKLFQKLLGVGRLSRLFGKIIPLVCSFFSLAELSNCRLVSKSWCLQIDGFLEQSRKVRNKYSGSVMDRYLVQEPNVLYEAPIFSISHMFLIPFLPDGSPSFIRDRVRENMKLHSRNRNPFVARTIKVTAAEHEYYEDNPDPDPRFTFQLEYPIFLNDFGQHIYHLDLSNDPDHQYGSAKEYYSTVAQSLSRCPNLKSIHLSGGEDFISSHDVQSGSEHNFPVNLPDHSSLNSISFSLHFQCLYGLVLQEKLIEKYSGQLSFLRVHHWNSQLYKNLPWGNLRGLEIIKPLTSDLTQSLKQVVAPNLQNLEVTLSSLMFPGNPLNYQRPKFHQFMELVNNFPNLSQLNIDMGRGSSIPPEEILSVSPHLTIQSSLTTLIINVTTLVDSISYDFLICFPFLKILTVEYDSELELEGRDSLDDSQSEDEDDQSSVNLDDDGENGDVELGNDNLQEEALGENVDDVATEDDTSLLSPVSNLKSGDNNEKGNVVEIAKYLWRDAENKEDVERMYKSNIWEILPSLEKVEVWTAKIEDGYAVDRFMMVYTRKGYDIREAERKSGQVGL